MDNLIEDHEEVDDVKKFENLLDKLIRENKIDRNLLLKKLQLKDDRPIMGGGNEILDEGEINDVLLDEQIL